MKLIPSIAKTVIGPAKIVISGIGNPLLGTIGSVEFEQCAAQFIIFSRNEGGWLGFEFPTQVPPKTVYQEMVSLGILYEHPVSDGWQYGLTVATIGKIYFTQNELMITQLKYELRCVQEESFLNCIKRHLRKMFVLPTESNNT